MRRNKAIAVIVLCMAAVISCIDARYLKDVFLNHVGTLVILCLLGWDIHKGFLSFGSFLCISIFCFFHILGARYLYSLVPYNEWSLQLFGWDTDAYFNFSRNHYDRFVHFLFGMLAFPALSDLFTGRMGMKRVSVLLFTWFSLLTFSMLYELVEWAVALVLSERSAENYNGQQGDIWDAHKDMALALLGSGIVFAGYLLKWKKDPESMK